MSGLKDDNGLKRYLEEQGIRTLIFGGVNSALPSLSLQSCSCRLDSHLVSRSGPMRPIDRGRRLRLRVRSGPLLRPLRDVVPLVRQDDGRTQRLPVGLPHRFGVAHRRAGLSRGQRGIAIRCYSRRRQEPPTLWEETESATAPAPACTPSSATFVPSTTALSTRARRSSSLPCRRLCCSTRPCGRSSILRARPIGSLQGR